MKISGKWNLYVALSTKDRLQQIQQQQNQVVKQKD